MEVEELEELDQLEEEVLTTKPGLMTCRRYRLRQGGRQVYTSERRVAEVLATAFERPGSGPIMYGAPPGRLRAERERDPAARLR